MSKAFQTLLDITTIYSMVWPLRIEKHSIWTQKYLPILSHILILFCRIAMRDLWWKVHDHAKFFVLCIHTFQLVSSSVRSKQLLCFVKRKWGAWFCPWSRPKKRTKTCNKELYKLLLSFFCQMHIGSHVVACEQDLIVALCRFQQKSRHGGSWGTHLARRRCANAMARQHDATKSTTPNSKISTKTMISHPARKWWQQ